jgi:chemosensory pili system protein ChpA (sensor histidine kinase/response regulator)
VSPARAHGTILVVDDDPSIRDLLRLHLSNADYKVVLAADAIAAGHILLKDVPDLMLLDLEMPYMTGLEFLEALRADAALPKFPVVFLTANPEARELAAKLGAAGYLAKPIFLNDLLAEVARHIPGAPTPIG